MSNFYEKYLEYVEPTEPPEIYHKWAALSGISAALQRKCWGETGHGVFTGAMYTLLVGPPGKTGKSTAIRFIRDLLRPTGVHVAPDVNTKEALARDMSELNFSFEDNETGELCFHSSIAVFTGEFSSFLRKDQDGTYQWFTSWYDDEPLWTGSTKKDGHITVPRPYISLLAGITHSSLQTLGSYASVDEGLTSRIIFVNAYEPKRSRFLRAGEPEVVESKKAELTDELTRIYSLSGKFAIPDDTYYLIDDWWVECDENPPFKNPLFGGYCRRRRMHCLKMAMLMSANRGSDLTITPEDLIQAKNILLETERTMGWVFHTGVNTQTSYLKERIKSVIGRYKERNLTVRQIRAFVGDIATPEHTGVCLRSLNESGAITLQIDPDDQDNSIVISQEGAFL